KKRKPGACYNGNATKKMKGIITKYRHCALIIVTIVFCSVPGIVRAQKFTASASSTNAGLNNSIRITYSLSDAQAESFQAPSFSGFNANGPYNSSSNNISFINGKSVVQSTQSWIYTLTPTKAGKFTIEPAKVKVNGQWISSNNLTIEVANTGTATGSQQQQQQTKQTQEAAVEASATDLFVKVFADKTNVMQGEQLTVTYKIYTRIPVSQYAIQKLPTFSGFWSYDLMKNKEQAVQYNETVNGQKYTVAEIRKVALFPQKSGKLTVDPLEVEALAHILVKKKANNPFGNFFNDPFFNDPFFQNAFTSGYQEVKKVLKSNALAINVSALPAGQPEDFCGLVGNLNMEATLDKNEVKSNDAVTLTVKISGKGNLNLIDNLNIEFPPDFEVYDPQITENISSGNEISGSKTFTYLIIPRTQGNFKLNPITLSYFDKNKKSYTTLSSGEINLKVGKGDGSGGAYSSSTSKEDIKYIGSDIKFIENKDFEVFPGGYFFFGSSWYWFLLVLPVLLFIAFVILMRRYIKLQSNTVLLKNRRATKVALKRLKQANTFMKSNERNNFYQELSKALWGYVCDKFSIPLSELSLDTARETLTSKNIEESIRTKFIEILDDCEFARFAPAEATKGMETLYNEAVEIISKTERELK
ncbi:MAG TPA: BatD family protein, partial [Bacteroidales bacterium]|nr:BatD family protein [Bacteroidales bacterium]